MTESLPPSADSVYRPDPAGELSLGQRGVAELEEITQPWDPFTGATTQTIALPPDLQQMLLDATSDGLLCLDSEGKVAYLNAAGARLLGSPTPDPIVGTWTHTQLHASCSARCPMLLAEEETVRHQGDEEFRTLRGALAPVTVTASPLVVDGIVTGLVVSFSDATARRALLEQQEAALAEAQRLEREKDEFVSVVSHELRTPLTAIMGYLDLVLDGEAGPVDERVLDRLGVVKRNATRLKAMVDQLLTLSRMESGKQEFRMQTQPIRPVIDGAVETVDTMARSKGITIAVDEEPGLPQVSVDRDLMERVVLNLMSNGVKFTPDGGRVTVRATYTRGQVVISVEDSGIGIPAAEQPRMFEKFFRSSLSQGRETPGTGLGLAIVKEIVERHGGQIALRSVEGEGTTFAVWLPTAEGSTPAT